jgi:flagellar hook-basal body complex protein FliE
MLLVGLVVGAGAAGVPLYQKLNATQLQLSTTQQKLTDTTQQLAATKQQLTSATLQVLQLQQQANASSQQVSELQQEQTHLQTQAVELAKPDLPVTVTVRPVLLGTGKTLEIHNLTTTPLPITAVFGRDGFPSETKELVVPAHFQLVVGAQQGWTFLSGDSVSLTNPRYRPKKGHIR